MRRLALILSLSASLTGACAEFGASSPSMPNPDRPQLKSDGKTVSIDQDVLVYQANGTPITVVWSLPAGGPYRFVAGRGIVVEGRLTDQLLRGATTSVVLDTQPGDIGQCLVDATGLNASCVNKRSRPGVYKYSIHITDGQHEIERDPIMANW